MCCQSILKLFYQHGTFVLAIISRFIYHKSNKNDSFSANSSLNRKIDVSRSQHVTYAIRESALTISVIVPVLIFSHALYKARIVFASYSICIFHSFLLYRNFPKTPFESLGIVILIRETMNPLNMVNVVKPWFR
jgi:hypothetical protein